MVKKNKNKSLLVTVAAAALLIGGGVGAYLVLTTQQTFRRVSGGANVVPQDAMMAIELSTDARQWEKLHALGTMESRAAFERNLAQLRDRFLTAYGYSYQRDIQPWVGDTITIAFLRNQPLAPATAPAPDSIPYPPAQQSMAIVLPIADTEAAREIFEQIRPQPQGEVAQRQYKGIKVLESQGAGELNYSLAVLDARYLVVTTSAEAMDRALDTYRGEPSLATIPGYAGAVAEIKTETPAFAQFYLNVPRATAFASANSTRPISDEKVTGETPVLQDNQGIATTAVLTSEGLEFKTVSWLNPNSEKRFAVENNATGMLERVPRDALMMLSGSNLLRVWQDYLSGAEANPVAPFAPEALRKLFQEGTGLELEDDFLNWMEGEFALSLIPVPVSEGESQLAAGFVLMVKASDRRAADRAFELLDQNMAAKDFQVGEAVASGEPVVKWTSPYGGYVVIRGWLGGNVAFMTVGAPQVANLILPAPTTPITENPAIARSLGQDDETQASISLSGNFFMDTDGAFNRENLSLPQLPPSQRVWVDAIDSISMTSVVSSDRRIRYDTLVKFKQGMGNGE
jgi:hypothetical protein